MSQKSDAHRSVVFGLQADHRRLNTLLVIGIVLVVAFALILIIFRPFANPVSEIDNIKAVPYSNELEMQYAQPWLDKQQVGAAPAIQYINSLEMQYAQPWLETQGFEAAPVVHFTDALEMQYAQPWLDKQQVEAAPAIQYSNSLEMQYAQPWLIGQQTTGCSGRLDMMYACKYGR